MAKESPPPFREIIKKGNRYESKRTEYRGVEYIDSFYELYRDGKRHLFMTTVDYTALHIEALEEDRAREYTLSSREEKH